MRRGVRRATIVASFALPLILAAPVSPSIHAATGYITVTALDTQGIILGVETLQYVASGGCTELSLPEGTAAANVANLTTREIHVYAQANCAGTGTATVVSRSCCDSEDGEWSVGSAAGPSGGFGDV